MHSDENERLRQRIKDLELALGQGNDLLRITFKLTPKLNSLMGLMVNLPMVSPEMIQQRLEIASDPKVAVNRLRKLLTAYDIKILNRRNLGYWIEDEAKLRIRQMLAEKQREAAAAAVTLESNDDFDDEFVEDAVEDDELVIGAEIAS